MAGGAATIPNLSEDVSIEELGDSVELKQVSAQSNQTIFPRSPQFWECLGGDKNGAFKDGFVRFQPSGQVKQTTMSFSHLSNYHARSKNISGPVLQKIFNSKVLIDPRSLFFFLSLSPIWSLHVKGASSMLCSTSEGYQ